MSGLTVELVWEGKNVRHWRVSRGSAGQMVTVRESALFPRVYCCLTCRCIDCVHADAVREVDVASAAGTVAQGAA